ncbi:MAG: hypothetical protein WBH86_15145, partial [Thermogutta sp.]
GIVGVDRENQQRFEPPSPRPPHAEREKGGCGIGAKYAKRTFEASRARKLYPKCAPWLRKKCVNPWDASDCPCQ